MWTTACFRSVIFIHCTSLHQCSFLCRWVVGSWKQQECIIVSAMQSDVPLKRLAASTMTSSSWFIMNNTIHNWHAEGLTFAVSSNVNFKAWMNQRNLVKTRHENSLLLKLRRIWSFLIGFPSLFTTDHGLARTPRSLKAERWEYRKILWKRSDSKNYQTTENTSHLFSTTKTSRNRTKFTRNQPITPPTDSQNTPAIDTWHSVSKYSYYYLVLLTCLLPYQTLTTNNNHHNGISIIC
jgi:hypothetical protein